MKTQAYQLSATKLNITKAIAQSQLSRLQSIGTQSLTTFYKENQQKVSKILTTQDYKNLFHKSNDLEVLELLKKDIHNIKQSLCQDYSLTPEEFLYLKPLLKTEHIELINTLKKINK